MENGPTIMKKRGGKLWCHRICIGKCNSMNTPHHLQSLALIWSKRGKENKYEMIQTLAKDTERQLGMMTVKRGEIMQEGNTPKCAGEV